MGLTPVLPIAILLILTQAFGVWLSRIGKPYNTTLFNIHKLIALGFVIASILLLRRSGGLINVEFQTLVIVGIVVAGLCVIALFVTGALLSIGKPDINLLRIIHQIAPVLLTISMAGMLYLVGIDLVG